MVFRRRGIGCRGVSGNHENSYCCRMQATAGTGASLATRQMSSRRRRASLRLGSVHVPFAVLHARHDRSWSMVHVGHVHARKRRTHHIECDRKQRDEKYGPTS